MKQVHGSLELQAAAVLLLQSFHVLQSNDLQGLLVMIKTRFTFGDCCIHDVAGENRGDLGTGAGALKSTIRHDDV
jgi:hypothetical protein